MEERATLRHKTVSKKLRFYDQTNTKESEVRRTQNLESQKLRAKVDMNKDQGNIFRVIDIWLGAAYKGLKRLFFTSALLHQILINFTISNFVQLWNHKYKVVSSNKILYYFIVISNHFSSFKTNLMVLYLSNYWKENM